MSVLITPSHSAQRFPCLFPSHFLLIICQAFPYITSTNGTPLRHMTSLFSDLVGTNTDIVCWLIRESWEEERAAHGFGSFCTLRTWWGSLAWQSLTVLTVKVEGGHLMLPSVQMLWSCGPEESSWEYQTELVYVILRRVAWGKILWGVSENFNNRETEPPYLNSSVLKIIFP